MEQYLALKASAGSGKTFALTIRYISLMLLNAKPSQILTLTFTNKAAAQMNQRIYDTLSELGSDEAVLEAISNETFIPKEDIVEKKQTLIEQFVSSELAIYTIDKFINKILREFSGYVGINDDFEIKFDDEELLIYKFLSSLEKEQFDTLISFAYSESKKLNSIVELLKNLNSKNEIQGKLSDLIQKEYSYESYSAVKTAILEDALEIKRFIIDSDLSQSADKAVEFDDIDSLLDRGKTWLSKDKLGEFSYFKKATIPVELEEKFKNLKKNILLYYQISESFTLFNFLDIFESFKNFRDNYNKKRNALEFDDITAIVYELMDKHIQRDFIYFRLDTKYNHILIDEFQDTSTIQFKILYHLIEEIISGDPENYKTFFYVGDIKQSIYRFRGGQKELFDYVAKLFSPTLEVHYLDTNYRSSGGVVEFVNSTFANIPNFEYEHQKVKSDITGYVEVTTVSNEKENIYESIYQKVEFLLNSGVHENQIAILTYTNKDVLEIYEYLKQKLPSLSLVTEMTSKLINQPNVEALINGVKYLYFEEDIYRVNFNALRGVNYSQKFEFHTDLLNQTPVAIVKEMAYFYKIMDDNVLRFIEVVQQYSSIVDFIYDIDKDDTVIASNTIQGVTILTIFKSKGLEYESVIVCDRITRKNPDRLPLLFDYNGIDIQKIYYKKSKRENIDPYYKEAIDKEKKLVTADELNILYVALTRAKHNMIVLKKEKNSSFELLPKIQDQTKGELYIDQNNSYSEKNLREISYQPLHLGYQDKQSEQDDNSNLKAKYFGLATHYCLELMGEFSLKFLENSLLLTQNKFQTFLEATEFEDIKKRITRLIENEYFQSLITDAKLYKEKSIVFNGEHKIIDLLIQKEDQYIIIDYKTTTEQIKQHIAQVELYKNGIKQITQNKETNGYIVYLHKEIIDFVKV